MERYLVQSGSVRRVVQADDARKAALWTVHLAMEPRSEPGRLGRRIRVLRADGLEAASWPIYEILLEWSQLLKALQRLEQAFAEEAVTCAPAATAESAASKGSRLPACA